MNAPRTITINLTISPDCPEPLRKAVTRLLKLVAIDRQSLEPIQQPVKHPNVWITTEHVREAADAIGLPRHLAGKAYAAFTVPTYRAQMGFERYASLFDLVSDVKLLDGRCMGVYDYIRLVENPKVRNALRVAYDPYGPKAEAASLKIAEYFKRKY